MTFCDIRVLVVLMLSGDIYIFQVPAIAAYISCAFFGVQVLIGIIKVKKFDERERLITGTA